MLPPGRGGRRFTQRRKDAKGQKAGGINAPHSTSNAQRPRAEGKGAKFGVLGLGGNVYSLGVRASLQLPDGTRPARCNTTGSTDGSSHRRDAEDAEGRRGRGDSEKMPVGYASGLCYSLHSPRLCGEGDRLLARCCCARLSSSTRVPGVGTAHPTPGPSCFWPTQGGEAA